MSAQEQTGGATAESSEQGTEYVVLTKVRFGDVAEDEMSPHRATAWVWREAGKASVRSADVAIREVVAGLDEADRKGTFVAIPSRSWKPVTVSEKVTRTLEIGS